MHRPFRRLGIVIVGLIFTSLACSLFTGKPATPVVPPTETQAPPQLAAPTQVPSPIPTEPTEPTATASPTALPSVNVNLGEEYRSPEGGFAFRTIPDYTVEGAFGLVSMTAPGADANVGPVILFIGEKPDEPKTNQQFIDDLKSQGEDVTITNQREVQVNGITGISAELSGTYESQEVAGRVVVVTVSPTQQFSMFGAAPRERWESELAPLFEAVLGTVNFFEPEEITFDFGTETPQPTEAGQVEELRQWATSASASSEYGSSDWSAAQAVGAPDTAECDDMVTAWAAENSDTLEWLELAYDVPVLPTQVNIYQSYNPSQVVKVELIDLNGDYHAVYEAQPEMTLTCPYVLSVAVPADVDYQVTGVRVTIDQAQLDIGWNEVDAVEVVGLGTAQDMALNPPDNTTGEDQGLAPASDLPQMANAENVYADDTLVSYATQSSLAAVRDFYLEQLPLYGWQLDLDENGQCRDPDRCTGQYMDYSSPENANWFFVQGDHAYLTMNLTANGDTLNVTLWIDPTYK